MQCLSSGSSIGVQESKATDAEESKSSADKSGDRQGEKEEANEEGEPLQDRGRRDHIFKTAYIQYLVALDRQGPRIGLLTKFAVMCARRGQYLLDEKGLDRLPVRPVSEGESREPEELTLPKLASSPYLCMKKARDLLEQV